MYCAGGGCGTCIVEVWGVCGGEEEAVECVGGGPCGMGGEVGGFVEGRGGVKVSTFLRVILEKRRRWIGVGGFRGFKLCVWCVFVGFFVLLLFCSFV